MVIWETVAEVEANFAKNSTSFGGFKSPSKQAANSFAQESLSKSANAPASRVGA
jgi:hypothetical protein